MGAFVDITENNIKIDSMFEEIRDTITYTRNYADDMRLSLTQQIEDLAGVIDTYNPSISDIDTDIPTIDGPQFPEKPTFAPLDLDDNWPDDIPSAPEFMDYGVMDFSFVAPSPPSEIDGNFDWSATEYTSEMWQALFSKVHNDILNGGTGLSDSIHAIIVEREKYARKASQDVEYRRGLDAVGARGFNLPSGQVAAFQRNIANQLLSLDQDALNNIAIKDFDLATENTRFAVSTGSELEKEIRSTYDSSENRSLEAKKAAKEYLIAVYNANVSAYIAAWDGVKTKMDAAKAKIDGIASYNDSLTKVYLGKADVYKSQVEAIVSKNDGLISARKGDVDVYTAEVNAIAIQFSALVDEVKTKLEGIRIEVNSAIKEEELKFMAYSDQTKLAEKIASEIAGISAQAVASALGAINTTLGNSYTGSESKKENWSHSESIKESHSFSEG